jgi:hypothetical protein
MRMGTKKVFVNVSESIPSKNLFWNSDDLKKVNYLIELRKSHAHHQFFEIFMKQKNLIETSFNKVLVNNLKSMFYRAFANYF